MPHLNLHKHLGFSLIELLVVIVIIGILGSLVLFNVSGVDQRKAMQAREIFLLDLNRIRKIAIDQNRIIALDTQPVAGATSLNYHFLQYHQQAGIQDENKKWQVDQELPSRSLPYQVSFTIESMDQNYSNASNFDLIQAQAPPLIWLGNGEVKPVRIQFYLEQKPIGNSIEIDHLGGVNAN